MGSIAPAVVKPLPQDTGLVVPVETKRTRTKPNPRTKTTPLKSIAFGTFAEVVGVDISHLTSRAVRDDSVPVLAKARALGYVLEYDSHLKRFDIFVDPTTEEPT